MNLDALLSKNFLFLYYSQLSLGIYFEKTENYTSRNQGTKGHFLNMACQHLSLTFFSLNISKISKQWTDSLLNKNVNTHLKQIWSTSCTVSAYPVRSMKLRSLSPAVHIWYIKFSLEILMCCGTILPYIVCPHLNYSK